MHIANIYTGSGLKGVPPGTVKALRLFAWIDLNAPFKGKWSPGNFEGRQQKERRLMPGRRPVWRMRRSSRCMTWASA